MKFSTWISLSWHLLKTGRGRFFDLNTWVAIGGISIGVACLVVSMSVMTGFEVTLQKSVTDFGGHLRIGIPSWSQDKRVGDKLQKDLPDFRAATEYLLTKAVVARAGNVRGVVIQGIDRRTSTDVLNFSSRVIDGNLNLAPVDGIPQAYIGTVFANELGLKIGDKFRIVVPLVNDIDPTKFRRKMAEFQVASILDFGKHEYNERFLVIDLGEAQTLSNRVNEIDGLMVRLADPGRARELVPVVQGILGPAYDIRDWREVNESLFQAVEIERRVIFFVVLIIVIAAAFVVAISLFINVVRRYPDIGLLKAVGASRKDVLRIFGLQGLLLGSFGLIFGGLLGAILCALFSTVESHWDLLQGSIYKVDHIDLALRFQDAVAIVFATLVICFLATLAPALKGAGLTPVEGLRNE